MLCYVMYLVTPGFLYSSPSVTNCCFQDHTHSIVTTS